MLTVHKFPVPVGNYFDVELPAGAKVLTVDVQRGHAQLWALVETEHRTETRRFRFAGTGHPIEEKIEDLRFVNTFQVEGGSLIFHIFEVVKAS